MDRGVVSLERAHQSVLLEPALDGLAIQPNGIYIDGTFGRGGHSRAILERLGADGRLIALDKDLAAVEYAQQHFVKDSRFTMVHASFAKLKDIAIELGVHGRVYGILLDLGVSSPQLDDPQRGFSFMQEGPLDMRMDQHQEHDASWFVNQASLEDMVMVFKEYGEERFAKRIAHAIVQAREAAPILTTSALAEIIKQANPKWEKHKHPATRVFQAIRIYINRELTDLSACLQQCLEVLAKEGRLVVISFHSLEDRIVKQFMRTAALGTRPPRGVPLREVDIKTGFKRIGKAIKPREEEVKQNIRARSAVLRIGEKTA